MYSVVDSAKSFEQAASDLDAAVKRNGFGVLHVHDPGATLHAKGQPFTEQGRVFEACRPARAAAVLATDMRLDRALPRRISVYTQQGQTRLGLIRPAAMLASRSPDPAAARVACEVDAQTLKMVDEAR